MEKFARLSLRAILIWIVSFMCFPAIADDQSESVKGCQLVQLASLDMTRQTTGRLTVPVSVSGTTYNFLVSLDGSSAVTDAVASKLQLRRTSTFGFNGPFISVMGLPAAEMVTVQDILIGNAHLAQAVVLVAGTSIVPRIVTFPEGDAVGGVLGGDILRRFDAELDFRSNKLKLFRQGDCGPSSVYWAHTYAAVPIEFDQVGSLLLKMQLDNKDVTAKIDLNAVHASMGTYSANQIFGINENSPGFTAVPGQEKLYRYPFKTLGIGGLTINNPAIFLHLQKDSEDCQGKRHGELVCWGGSDITIGMPELRALHMFFSFDEKKLYLTSADEHL